MTTGKTIPLTRWTFVGKMMSLLFNMLSRFVIAFLPGSKHLLRIYRKTVQKKDPNDPDNHNGVVHLEPDILQCEVKWALGSITMNRANGGGGILVELFKILKDDVVKVLHSVCQQIWKSQQWFHRTEKGQFSFQFQKSPPLCGGTCSRACTVPCF